MHDTHGNCVSVRGMLFHQNVKRRDGRAEPGLWRWMTDLCLVPVHIQQENLHQEHHYKRNHSTTFYLLFFHHSTHFPVQFYFCSFSPLISPKASWSLCLSLSKAISPWQSLPLPQQFPCESFLITCGKQFGAHFPPQRRVLTEITAIANLQDRMQAQLFEPLFNAISKQVCSV